MLTYDIKDTKPGPIISHLCQQLNVRETVNDAVPWDKKQCLLDPGMHVEALIINILCRRDPLYRGKYFFTEQDVQLLFGKGVEANNFNDDALGKTLGKTYATGTKKVFSAVAPLVFLLGAGSVLGQSDPAYGVPRFFFEVTPGYAALMTLPLLMAIAGAAVVFFAVLAWWKGYWRLRARLHYTLFTAATLAFLWFMYFWNLL